MPDETISAEDLIRLHSDQAFHEGSRLFSQAVEAHETELARGLAQALRQLHKRGYDRIARKDPVSQIETAGLPEGESCCDTNRTNPAEGKTA